MCRFICKVCEEEHRQSSSEKAASFEEDKGKWAEASGMDLFSVENRIFKRFFSCTYLPIFPSTKRIFFIIRKNKII